MHVNTLRSVPVSLHMHTDEKQTGTVLLLGISKEQFRAPTADRKLIYPGMVTDLSYLLHLLQQIITSQKQLQTSTHDCLSS